MISGFADEINKDFDAQIATLRELGMGYLCIRALDGRSIAAFSPEEAQEYIKPRLDAAGLRVSSLGSPIGKIPVDDEAAFETQLDQLEALCEIAGILDCRYLRLFSFYLPKDGDPERYFDAVKAKMAQFIAICEKYGVVPMHENEKGIYGETGARCVRIHEAFADTSLIAAYDFANFVQCDEDPVVCYERLKPYIGYVHVKDARAADHKNVLCGAGDGQIAKILADLQKNGYDGFLTMEPHLKTFESLKNLEADASHTVQDGVYENGAAAFTAQYRALCAILDAIGVS